MATNTAIEKQVMSQIEKLKKRFIWATENKGEKDNAAFKIDYCNAEDKEWHIAKKRTENAKDFLKIIKEIINVFGADAVRVSLMYGNKPFETEIIRVKSVEIPFLDQIGSKAATNNYNKDIAPYFEKLTEAIHQTSGLSGANDFILQGIQRESENQIGLLQLKHEHAVERLQDKIESLTEKLEDKENRIEELEEELNELDELIEGLKKNTNKDESLLGLGKQGGVLLAAGVGRLLKMNNTEIMGLAGLMSGSDVPALPEKASGEELLSPEQAKASQKRANDIAVISHWLTEINEDSFEFVCFILRNLAEKPELYAEIQMLIEGKSKAVISSKTDESKFQTPLTSTEKDETPSIDETEID